MCTGIVYVWYCAGPSTHAKTLGLLLISNEGAAGFFEVGFSAAEIFQNMAQTSVWCVITTNLTISLKT